LTEYTYESYKLAVKKQIKEHGYEEVLIRLSWNLTLLMNNNPMPYFKKPTEKEAANT